MNFLDAVKSGKEFRRRGEDGWGFGIDDSDDGLVIKFYREFLGELIKDYYYPLCADILADDWEVKDEN